MLVFLEIRNACSLKVALGVQFKVSQLHFPLHFQKVSLVRIPTILLQTRFYLYFLFAIEVCLMQSKRVEGHMCGFASHAREISELPAHREQTHPPLILLRLPSLILTQESSPVR